MNIPKKKKEDEIPKKKAVGMGDLMSELRDKIGGGKMKMKKVERKVGKLHHKKSGGKKGGFTDIMDELSHTLAKLRGEILDDSPVKPSPGKEHAVGSESKDKNVDGDEDAIGSEKDILATQPEDGDDQKRRKSFTLGVQRLLLRDTDDAEERRNSVSSATGDEAAPRANQSKFSKYEVMSKNKLPEGAIRQRMSLDGLSGMEQDSFFSGSYLNDQQEQHASSASNQEKLVHTPTVPSKPAMVNDPSRYEKYEKMVRMLPEVAVRQKMSIDGFEDDEIDTFFKNGGVAPSAAPTAVPLPTNIDDPSRYEKYEKMVRMLPEGAVRQKMSIDGFEDDEIDTFFKNGGVAPSAAPIAGSQQSNMPTKADLFVPYEAPPLPRPDEIDFTEIIAAPLQNVRISPLPSGFYVVKQDSSKIERFGYVLAGTVLTYKNILRIAQQNFEFRYGSPTNSTLERDENGNSLHSAEPKRLDELHKPYFFDGKLSSIALFV